jgi:hypothetical protein
MDFRALSALSTDWRKHVLSGSLCRHESEGRRVSRQAAEISLGVAVVSRYINSSKVIGGIRGVQNEGHEPWH